MTLLAPAKFLGLLLPILLLACANTCKPSTPPVRGVSISCQGIPLGYYWDGNECVADIAKACGDTPAKPSWPTLEECQDAHRECSL